jgi:hypothetical protein
MRGRSRTTRKAEPLGLDGEARLTGGPIDRISDPVDGAFQRRASECPIFGPVQTTAAIGGRTSAVACTRSGMVESPSGVVRSGLVCRQRRWPPSDPNSECRTLIEKSDLVEGSRTARPRPRSAEWSREEVAPSWAFRR